MFLGPLAITDRILDMWASSQGSGLAHLPEQVRTSRAPPLPDDLAIDVDKLILRAPAHVITILRCWYCYSDPYSEIRRRLRYRQRSSIDDAVRQAVTFITIVFATHKIMSRFERSLVTREALRQGNKPARRTPRTPA